MLEDNYPGYDLIRNFNPKGNKFVFNLSKYDCYRLSKGKCSLQIKDQSKIAISNSINLAECSYQYCIVLVNSLKENGVTNKIYPVRIIRNSCGHYSIEDGQHRLCSSANANVNIDVYVQKFEGECRVCYFRKKSIRYRIKDVFKKIMSF